MFLLETSQYHPKQGHILCIGGYCVASLYSHWWRRQHIASLLLKSRCKPSLSQAIHPTSFSRTWMPIRKIQMWSELHCGQWESMFNQLKKNLYSFGSLQTVRCQVKKKKNHKNQTNNGKRLSKAHKRFQKKGSITIHCKHKVVGPGFTIFYSSVVFFRDTWASPKIYKNCLMSRLYQWQPFIFT